MFWKTSSSNENTQFFSYCLKDCWNDFKDAIDKAQKTALDVFVIVSEYSIKHVKELYLVLNNRHPPEVELE